MNNKQKISILGPGRWGTTLAWVYQQHGYQVTLWGRPGGRIENLKQTRQNDYLALPQEIVLTKNLAEALVNEIIFIAIKAQNFRELCQNLKELHSKKHILILAMKGIEIDSGKRLTEVAQEALGQVKVAVMVGPGQPQRILTGEPTTLCLANDDSHFLQRLAKVCQTKLTAIELEKDLLGVEIGAALKNVIGVAGGLLDGLGKTALKETLRIKGPAEVGRLIKVMGGNKETALGLSHLADYEMTAFYPLSRNRLAGEKWTKEHQLDESAEGVPTAKATKYLMDKYQVKMPICQMVYQILYQGRNPEDLVDKVLSGF